MSDLPYGVEPDADGRRCHKPYEWRPALAPAKLIRQGPRPQYRRCGWCGTPVEYPKTYCTDAHKQAAYRARKKKQKETHVTLN